jgi:uncharacterized protein (DUF952 family)
MSVILHLATALAWESATRAEVYDADSLATEGFIHCSTPEQVLWVANSRFRNRRDLVLLQIDTARLDVPVRYENLEGGHELFPHIYGPLPTTAVVRVTPFPANADGGFDVDQLAASIGRLQGDPMTGDEQALHEMAQTIAAAIGRRDVRLLGEVLAPGFTYRSDNGQSVADAAAFLDGVRGIPGEIVFVQVERVAADVAGDAAMVTGVQHAQVRVDGQTIDDRRAFGDFFVKISGEWKLRAGADFPLPSV